MLIERIKKRCVISESGCWLWQGSLVGDGYGGIWVDGTMRRVHKVAYEAVYGPVPTGLVMDHLCRTISCANPDHLEAVTQRTNLMRGNSPSAIHAAKTACPICGGEYAKQAGGLRRRCIPCARALGRVRDRKRYKAKREEIRAKQAAYWKRRKESTRA